MNNDAGVTDPANGRFLVLKSADPDRSDEADEILDGVADEDPQATDDEIEKALARSTDPAQRQALGLRLTHNRLRRLHESDGTPVRKETIEVPKTEVIKELEKLGKKLRKENGDPALVAQVEQALTHDRLRRAHEGGDAAKGAYTGALQAHQDRVAANQQVAANQRSATLAATADPDPRAQLAGARDGTYASRALPKPIGESGSLPGVIKELHEKLDAATDPIEKARLGEQITHALLRASHGG